MILYHSVGSRGLRALWTLEELGLDCELKLLPFPPRKQEPSFMDVNALGTVPTLVDGELVMTESVAITQYLCTRAAGTPLLVDGGEPDHGVFLDFLQYADATLTFPLTVFLRFAMMETGRGLAEAGNLYFDWFLARSVKLERRLGAREYLCGERLTIADIACAYPLHLASLIGRRERLNLRVRLLA